MRVERVVEQLYKKYSAIAEDSSVEDRIKKLYINPLIGLMEIAIDLASFHDDRMQSSKNFVGLMQLVSTAYANNLRLTVEESLGLDSNNDDVALQLMYTPQVMFYPDFFDLIISDADAAKEAGEKFIMVGRWLSDNSYSLEKPDALVFLMKNTGLKIDDVSISSLDSAMTAAIAQAYSVAIFLLMKK
ncbi:hypothetical protein PHLH6_20440 [Pseudomonas sp. Seg1]|uniref:hypothetical protein n=1 Tax=Pseudomonas sp. Seg1 TaxID=2678259 RepID=UPI001BB40DDB|nr:hypothetical protein [Pseudomonas sp. Seg1]BBP70040.1 hypothetical protein PHLH6_20440 [Pseudomonas sp. Seg1]